MGEKKPLMEMLIEAGYPESEIYHHETDLYVFVTPLTIRILDKWLIENGFKQLKWNPFLVNRFIDNITGKPMYDIAFQYLPAWDDK